MIADRIKCAVPQPFEHDLLRRAWTVPVLVVSKEPRYFTDIKNELVSITDRALSQSLKQLQAQHWIQRKVDTAMRPARPLYQVANAGARISHAVSLDAL